MAASRTQPGDRRKPNAPGVRGRRVVRPRHFVGVGDAGAAYTRPETPNHRASRAHVSRRRDLASRTECRIIVWWELAGPWLIFRDDLWHRRSPPSLEASGRRGSENDSVEIPLKPSPFLSRE